MRERTMAEVIRDQRPLSMGPDATVAEACAAMHARRVGAVLVTEPAGAFSASSRAATRCAASRRDWTRATPRCGR